jgi:hypothetical protein
MATRAMEYGSMFYDLAAILYNKRGHVIEDYVNVTRNLFELRLNIFVLVNSSTVRLQTNIYRPKVQF